MPVRFPKNVELADAALSSLSFSVWFDKLKGACWANPVSLGRSTPIWLYWRSLCIDFFYCWRRRRCGCCLYFPRIFIPFNWARKLCILIYPRQSKGGRVHRFYSVKIYWAKRLRLLAISGFDWLSYRRVTRLVTLGYWETNTLCGIDSAGSGGPPSINIATAKIAVVIFALLKSDIRQLCPVLVVQYHQPDLLLDHFLDADIHW